MWFLQICKAVQCCGRFHTITQYGNSYLLEGDRTRRALIYFGTHSSAFAILSQQIYSGRRRFSLVCFFSLYEMKSSVSSSRVVRRPVKKNEAKRKLDEVMSRAKAQLNARQASMGIVVSQAVATARPDASAAPSATMPLPVVASTTVQMKRKRDDDDPRRDETTGQQKRQRFDLVADILSTMDSANRPNRPEQAVGGRPMVLNGVDNGAKPTTISAEVERMRQAARRRRHHEASLCAANLDYARGNNHDRFVRWVTNPDDKSPHFVDLTNWQYTIDEYFGRRSTN